MTNTLLRAGLRACVLMTTTALTAPALAQTASDIAPPVRYQVDENGIDVAEARHILNVTDISIGPDGPGGLAYTRQLRRMGGGSSYDIALFQSGTSWRASVGLESYAFTQNGTNFASADGSGATLVQNGTTWTLTTPRGATIVYDYNILATEDLQRRSRASRIDYPTGDRTTLTWVSDQWCDVLADTCPTAEVRTGVRLQAVSSSTGYQLHFNYGLADAHTAGQSAAWKRLDSITAINTQVEACDPAAHSCSLTGTWPTVQYGGGAVTDPEGRTTTYTLSTTDFRIRRPGSTSDDIVYNYDGNARVTSVVRDGMTWNYTFTENATNNTATLEVSDPANHQRTIVSDRNVGLPTSVAETIGGSVLTTTYQYGPGGLLERATAPEGNYVEYDYDARGNVTETRAVTKATSGAADIVTSAVYPSSCANPIVCNLPTSTTDARGNTTDYTYDPTHGGLLTVTLPAPATGGVRPQTRYTYSSLAAPDGPNVHRLTNVSACRSGSSCDGSDDETETQIAYAHSNLLVSSVTRRAGDGSPSAMAAMTYDDYGNVTRVDGPLTGSADTSGTRYNLARQVVGTISPDPDGNGNLRRRATRISYNAAGLPWKIESGRVDGLSDTAWDAFVAFERVEIAYDSHQRPSRRTLIGDDDVAVALIQTNYNSEGLPNCTAVRMNPAEFTSLPNACVLGASGGMGVDRIVQTTYNARHQPSSVTTALGTSAAATESSTYTANGRLETVTDGEENRTTYVYDGHDRLRRIRYPLPNWDNTSSDTDYEQFTRDAAGNVTSHRLRNGNSTTYDYDALGRVTQKRAPGQSAVDYTYDNLGRLTSAAIQDGQTVTFTYDALGRNLTQTGPRGTVSSQYDEAGRRTRMAYPDGNLVVGYTYNTVGEVTHIHQQPDGANLLLATFAYDNRGRRTSLTRGDAIGSTTTYAYDPMSRLEQLVQNVSGTANDLTLSLTYNPASQIRTLTRSNDAYAFTSHANGSDTFAHNGLNQITTIDTSVTVEHNLRGDVTQIGSATYGYTSEHLMTSAPGDVTMRYDPLMRLYEVAGPTETSRFAWDGGNIIAEYGGANGLRRRWIYDPGTNQPLVWIEGTGSPADRRWLHADERGSVIAVSDGNGAVTDVNRYDAWGNPQGGTVPGRFGYTGQMWIAEAGLWYYRARMYNPQLGRFMQPDPIGYGAGLNLYAYVLNDPLNLIDPRGLTPDVVDDNPPPKHDGGACHLCSWTAGSPSMLGFPISGDKRAHKETTWADGTVTTGTSPWVPITGGMGQQPSFHLAQWWPSPRFHPIITALEILLSAKELGENDTLSGRCETTPSQFCYTHKYRYDPRVLERAQQDPRYHNFPYTFDDRILSQAPTREPDGSLTFRHPGFHYGRPGNFEIGLNPTLGVIYHRMFRPDR